MYGAAAMVWVKPKNAVEWWDSVVPVFAAVGADQPLLRAEADAVPSTMSFDMPWDSAPAMSGSTACSQAGRSMKTCLPFSSSTSLIGFGSHQRPPEAKVAPTLDSSSAFTASGPKVKAPMFSSFAACATERPSPNEFSSAYDRRPKRTARSTTGATPVFWISSTNVVFGDCASASCSVMRGA